MGTNGTPQKIVVGIDGSPASRQALQWSLDEAGRRDATVIAIHAWEAVLTRGQVRGAFYREELGPELAEAVLAEVLDAVDVPAGTAVERRGVRSDPAHALIEAGKDADLVVVGSRRLGQLGRLTLGSISTRVVHHAPCPVVVVPAEV